jgi:hypothetical protein
MQLDPADGRDAKNNAAQDLYWAVIMRAVMDALFLPHMEKPEESHTQAISFCTDTFGGWAESRRAYCDALGLEPERLRQYVIDVLENRADAPDSEDENGRDSHRIGLATSRRMWAKNHSASSFASPPAQP